MRPLRIEPPHRVQPAAVVLALIAHAGLPAQTHHELRDPKRGVFEAFPAADGYRSIVRSVDEEARARVEARLPFRVHFQELGDHALYVALRGRRPIGLLHVRSEQSRWGLVEIGWSLRPDLGIAGFALHRCRHRQRAAFERSPFARSLIGLQLDDLAVLLDGKARWSVAAGKVPPGTEELAGVVVRSAMKTIAVTMAVWGRDVDRIRDLDLGLEAFPLADHFRRLVPEGAAAPEPPGGGARPDEPFDVRALRAKNERGETLGTVLEGRMRLDKRVLRLRWRLGPDVRNVQAVAPVAGWPDPEVQAAFHALEGRRFDVTDEDRGAAGVAARVVRLALSLTEDAGTVR